MNYLIYISLGILPSLIWLFFFLKKDSHPESNRMVIKIFLYGMLAALPAILAELGLLSCMPQGKETLVQILYLIFGIALIEEFLKYLVVKEQVLSDPECDEPTDIMLYMIISALGFAAIENIFNLFSLKLSEALAITAFRFVGAVFLHALCSGIFGYFLALSFLKTKKRTELLFAGFAIAVTLHGLFNFSIIALEGNLNLIALIIILIVSALAVSSGFQRLKKTASVCRTR